MVAKDFEGPDVASEELRDRMSLQRRRMVTDAAFSFRRLLHLHGHPNVSEAHDLEVGQTLRKVILPLAMRLHANTKVSTKNHSQRYQFPCHPLLFPRSASILSLHQPLRLPTFTKYLQMVTPRTANITTSKSSHAQDNS